MSDPVLHIKDSYYFDVPKVLFPVDYRTRSKFPEVWGQNDPEFQAWEFGKMYHSLAEIVGSGIPAETELHHQWEQWQHDDHGNFAKPFDAFLSEARQAHIAAFNAWKADQKQAGKDKEAGFDRETVATFLQNEEASANVPYPQLKWFTIAMEDGSKEAKWNKQLAKTDYWSEYIADDSLPDWSKEKLDAYNSHLSGKILIPQVFGAKLRNLYEPDYSHSSAPAISKFMVIEFVVAIVLILAFSWVGKRTKAGGSPKGALWNLLEVFIVFIRDTVARPAIGAHHHDDHTVEPVEVGAIGDEPHHAEEDAPAVELHGAASHAHDSHGHNHHAHHNPYELADQYVPVLWTVFLFILGCNLSGMIPWMGSPTGSWSVTLALALTMLGTVVVAGVSEFGPIGFLMNQVPTMDIKGPLGWVIKTMIFFIEIVGLLIKHAVLSIRLLANMVAGHLVLLGIMGISFSVASATYFMQPDTPGILYWISATCSVLGSTILSILELGVAFLQAYVFTLLSALFIGSAVHKH